MKLLSVSLGLAFGLLFSSSLCAADDQEPQSEVGLEAFRCYSRGETLRETGRDRDRYSAEREATSSLRFEVSTARMRCEREGGRFTDGIITTRCRQIFRDFECVASVQVRCDCP